MGLLVTLSGLRERSDGKGKRTEFFFSLNFFFVTGWLTSFAYNRLVYTCLASRLPASVVSVQSTGNLPAEASRPLKCFQLVLLKCVPFIV